MTMRMEKWVAGGIAALVAGLLVLAASGLGRPVHAAPASVDVPVPTGAADLRQPGVHRAQVVFAGGGVHSLIEGDLLPAFYLNGVPTNDWLGLYPYVECLVAQAIAAVAVIALFVVGFIKQRKLKAQATVEVPAVKA